MFLGNVTVWRRPLGKLPHDPAQQADFVST
jgi:hypothetical protein